ncbi:MAG TPA: class I SAM-dependent methyltransferase [Pirellulales bacterium]|nr:class I SAM-dependent methyltransferase [Pirellulales bacterium]
MIARLWKSLKNHRFGLWEMRTAWLDARFGGYCGGRVATRFRHMGASDVHNMSYRIIHQAMSGLVVEPEDVLVDVGCGRGRVLNWWLSQGITNRVVGIELDPVVAATVKVRLAKYGNVEVLGGDAVELTPADATICFLFNPFDDAVLQRWHDAVLSRSTAPHLSVIYINPRHVTVFEKAARWTIDFIPRDVATFFDIAVMKLRNE